MVIASLMDGLEVDYALAQELLETSNISGGGVPKDLLWTNEQGEVSFPVQKIVDIIKYDLDFLCESVENFFTKHYKEKGGELFAVNPIGVTGEGIVGIAGATEHIANRLNRLTEIVFPDLPYYDKPTCSSKIALLNAASIQKKKRGWIHKFFNGLGGNK